MATNTSEDTIRELREFSSKCSECIDSAEGQSLIEQVLYGCRYITWCRKCGNDYAKCQGRRCGPRRNWNLERAKDARIRFEKRTGKKWIVH